MLPPKSKIIALVNWNQWKQFCSYWLNIRLYETNDVPQYSNKGKLDAWFVLTLETKLFSVSQKRF